jgi:hypothetical protein
MNKTVKFSEKSMAPREDFNSGAHLFYPGAVAPTIAGRHQLRHYSHIQ